MSNKIQILAGSGPNNLEDVREFIGASYSLFCVTCDEGDVIIKITGSEDLIEANEFDYLSFKDGKLVIS